MNRHNFRHCHEQHVCIQFCLYYMHSIHTGKASISNYTLFIYLMHLSKTTIKGRVTICMCTL